MIDYDDELEEPLEEVSSEYPDYPQELVNIVTEFRDVFDGKSLYGWEKFKEALLQNGFELLEYDKYWVVIQHQETGTLLTIATSLRAKRRIELADSISIMNRDTLEWLKF